MKLFTFISATIVFLNCVTAGGMENAEAALSTQAREFAASAVANALERNPEEKAALAGKVDLYNLHDVGTFQRFLESVSPSFDENLPIRLAARLGHTKELEILLNTPNVDPAAKYNEAIGLASRYGHTEVVKLLLDSSKVDPAVIINYPIRIASKYGHADVVKLLLDSGKVNPGDRYNEAIRIASYNGHAEVVKLLLDSDKVNPAELENEAIRMASMNGHIEVVKVLLESPKVNPADRYNSAFTLASLNNHDDIVSLLKHDQIVSSIDYLQRAQQLTPTRFLSMIDTKRACSNAPYIERVLKYHQVSELLSNILGIYPRAAREITNIEQLNQKMIQLLQSLDMNDQKLFSPNRFDFNWRFFGTHSRDNSERLDFLLRYFDALSWYSEENASQFNQLMTKLYGKKNLELTVYAKNGNLDKVKALLSDHDIDLSASNYLAIEMAFNGGHTEVVEVLEEYERKKFPGELEHCFCMGQLFPKMGGVSKTSCGHSFHIKCITAWKASKSHPTCPFCRSDI